MKKAIIISIFILSFLIFPSSVLAENLFSENEIKGPKITPPASISPFLKKPNFFQRIRLENQSLSTKNAEIRARINEKKREILRRFFNQMIERFQAAINRLEKLISRIESRLAKIKSQGKNVSQIENRLSEAKTKLNDAKANLELLKNKIENLPTSNDELKNFFIETKNLVKSIKIQLIEVHQILVHLIGDIKGLRVGQITPTPIPSP
jgi:chromosome segregation ATPase